MEPRRQPGATYVDQDAIDDAAGDATFFVRDASQIVTAWGATHGAMALSVEGRRFSDRAHSPGTKTVAGTFASDF